MEQDYLVAIEDELRVMTTPPSSTYEPFFNILKYHLGWTDPLGVPVSADSGKRIRPQLCLLSCQALGGDWRQALPAAAAIELIHNFSLIHDDIEDNSEERRGRPAVWKLWGLAHGINSGDAMFALAHIALGKLGKGVSPDQMDAIHRAFELAVLKLTLGQFLDLQFERADQINPDLYFEMVEGKTAALVAAACEIGARIASSNETLVRAFNEYGKNLGIAFQIADDILGIWGDPAITGKSAHADLTSRKKSYPVLAAFESETSGELRALYDKLEWSKKDLEQVLHLINASGARTTARMAAVSFAEKAVAALAGTGIENEYTQKLNDLVNQVVHREK